MDRKTELRQQIRLLKKEYAPHLPEMSRAICHKVINDGIWRWAGTILLYHALKDEVDTALLIENAERMGKCIVLPVVVGDDLELRLYEGRESLKPGAFGILEPTGTLFPEDRYDEITLAIVPGMAFDAYGNRLGRGKGFYDRLLPRLRRAYKIGICFPFQKVDVIDAEEHDIRMNEIVN